MDLKGNHIGSFDQRISDGSGCVQQIRGLVILDWFMLDKQKPKYGDSTRF
jgi:hypothetical protein